ncbi:hypothetical protein LDC_0829 [sediment metagenome]|uniref:Uncharacterized protein n=1 Tax=sediment metagenome TaxID=749907 RepID=D9PH30_9ZZZZ
MRHVLEQHLDYEARHLYPRYLCHIDKNEHFVANLSGFLEAQQIDDQCGRHTADLRVYRADTALVPNRNTA